MMEMAKVTSKGQITIPISIRRKLGINEGNKILFINKEDGVLMVNPDTFQGDLSEEAIDSPVKPKEIKKKDKASTPVKKEAPAAALTPAQTTKYSSETAPEPTPEPARAPHAHLAEPAPYTEAPKTEEPPSEEENSQSSYAPIEYATDIDDDFASRTVAAPVTHKPEEQPDIHAGGVNLSTLLDDIRSIGSKI